MPERYFVLTFFSAKARISASTREKKIFYSYACANELHKKPNHVTKSTLHDFLFGRVVFFPFLSLSLKRIPCLPKFTERGHTMHKLLVLLFLFAFLQCLKWSRLFEVTSRVEL